MPEKSGSSEAPSKPVKLRESCDSCLLAKVKCSKQRPLCSRCLSNGAPCDYSPSSRAGKRNRNATASGKSPKSAHPNKRSSIDAHSNLPDNTAYLTRLMYPLLDEEDRALLNPNSPLLQHGAGIKIPLSGTGGFEDFLQECEPTEGAEYLPTPPFSHTDFSEPFVNMSSIQPNIFGGFSHGDSSPTNPMDNITTNAWAPKDNPHFRLPHFQSPFDLMPMAPSYAMPMNHTPFPPQMPSSPPNESAKGKGCDCFAACLQVLQSLHNHSTLLTATNQHGPPFDIVLTINREAIDSASTMLDCNNCVFKSGRSISTMMLATIFGKVMSLYRAACFLRFGSSTATQQASAQLAFGAYTVTGENRQLLEIEILLLELRKVERTLQHFAERFQNAQQTEKDDEAGIYGALTCYLEKNLQHIVEFLQARKGGMHHVA